MIPEKKSVLRQLEEIRRADQGRNIGWVRHSICVGDAAGVIAGALNQAGQEIDAEKVTLMGYLHDIGKSVGPSAEHPYNGYRQMQKLGYDEEYCIISLTHSFVNNDPFCMFSDFMQPGRDDFVIEFIRQHDFTLEERLITLCDHLATTKIQTIEQRMIDVIRRHGVCGHTQERIDAAMKLKTDFDKLLGYNLYDLFPEIKENL